MLIKIYDKTGTLKAEVSPDSSSTQVKEIQGDNVLSLSFTLPQHIAFDVDDYADFEGERYWLTRQYRPKQKSTVEWSYNLKMYGVDRILKNILVIKSVDGDDEPVFSLTASPREHMALIVSCLNSGSGAQNWQIGVVDGTDNITIDYTGKYCDEALRELAEKTGAEYWTSGTTLYLTRCEYGEPITLGYDKGLTSLDCADANNVKFYTRLFPVGSSRNIDPVKYGSSRLHLPGNQRYVEINADKYSRVDHFEESAFADIYPRYTGTVSSVRSEEVTGEDGNKFTIYYFKDVALPFDPNDYEIGGLVKRVSFQTGDLAGLGNEDQGTYYFEVNFDSTTQEFEIITIWPSGYDGQLPGAALVPKAGDSYIPWNITMPDEYYPLAEAELLAAVNKYNAKNAIDVAIFKAPTDHVWIEQNNIMLKVGQRVRLESENYFPGTGYRDSRITKITRKVNMPSQMELEIGDALSRGTLDKLQDSINDIRNKRDDIEGFIDSVLKPVVDDIKAQVDGKAQTWYQATNPADAWTIPEVKAKHKGDLWYCTVDIDGTEFKKGTTWFWNGVAWEKQNIPQSVFDTIDGKADIYVSKPTSGYHKNDLWFLEANYTLSGIEYKSGTLVVAINDMAESGWSANDWIKKDRYTDDTALNTFIESYKDTIKDIKLQVDGKAETWYQSTNPANAWTTVEAKAAHKGDLWYCTADIAGTNYKQGTTWYWNGTTWEQQNIPQSVFDTIDGKSAIYVAKPTSGYKKNDLWFLEADYTLSNVAYKSGTLVVAIRDMGTAWSANDWVKKDRYTDDTLAQQAKAAADKAQADADKAEADAKAAKDRLDQWAADGVISPTEKQAIKDEIARIDADKTHITAEYTRYGIGTPTAYNNAYTAYRNQLVALSAATPENITIPSNFASNQTAYYNARTAALSKIAEEAKKYAENIAKQEAEKAVAGYKYLKEALGDVTTIAGGLMLSSQIRLGQHNADFTTQTTWAGHNGVYDNGRTIGSWWGGDMIDRFDANDNRLNVAGKRYATALIRMDGSAYFGDGSTVFKANGSGWLANGNIQFDVSGNTQFGKGDTAVTISTNGSVKLGNGILIDIGGQAQGLGNSIASVTTVVNAMQDVLVPVNDAGARVPWAQATRVKSTLPFYSESWISGRGVGSSTGGSSGGGTATNLLTSWGAYTTDMANNYALSAGLGYGLRSDLTALTGRVSTLEGKNYLDALTLAQLGSGNAVTALSLSSDKKTLTVTKGATFLTNPIIPNGTDISSITANGLFVGDTDGNSGTFTNSPFNNSFMMLTQTCYNVGTDVRRPRVAVSAYGAMKVFNDRDTAGNGGVWYDVVTSANKESILSGSFVTLSTAQTITGAKTFSAELKATNKVTFLSEGKLKIWGVASTRYSTYGDEMVFVQTSIDGADPETSWPDKNRNDLFLQPKGGHVHIGPIEVAQNNTLYVAGDIKATSGITAASFIRSGGTSSQFLMADGSVKALTDITDTYLPLAGGTMTGALYINNALFVANNSTYRAVMGGGSSYIWLDCRDSSETVQNNFVLYPTYTKSGKYLNAPYYTASTTTLCTNLNADLWDGQQFADFRMRKIYTLDLSALSTSNFYPVTFQSTDYELDCEIHSPNLGNSAAYNQNHMHFLLTAQGWSDTVQVFRILSQGYYDYNELTIGAIGDGNKGGIKCVWLRGGMKYRIIANHAPTLRTSDFSNGNEIFTVGTNLYGGTNANVTIRWQNNADRTNYQFAIRTDNVASATKLQTARTINGTNFDGTANITTSYWGTARTLWGQSVNGSQNINGTFYFTNGDATMKLYGAVGAFTTDSECVAIQTSFDGQDPLTSTYPTTYAARAVLSLQPRGGRVGVNTTTPAYSLDVNGTLRATSIVLGSVTLSYDSSAGALKIDGAAYTTGWFSAKGVGSSAGGTGGAVNLLTAWGSYTTSMANTYALSAGLGYDLHTRLQNVYTKGTCDGRYGSTLTISGSTLTLKSPDGTSLKSVTLPTSSGTTGSYLPLSGGTLTGDLRLKDSSNYGRSLLFGDGSFCYLKEDTDDHLTIYAAKGINLSVGSGYNVTINGSAISSGGSSSGNYLPLSGGSLTGTLTTYNIQPSSTSAGRNIGTSSLKYLQLFMYQAVYVGNRTSTQAQGTSAGSCLSSGWLSLQSDVARIDFTYTPSAAASTIMHQRLMITSSSQLELQGSNYSTSTGKLIANVTAPSDATLKTVTGDVSLTIEQIAHAPAVNFIWKDSGIADVGSLAQYWRTYLPYTVGKTGAGTLTFDYGRAALLSAIVTARRVLTVESRMLTAEERIESLTAEVTELKEKLNQYETNNITPNDNEKDN